jgi:formylglycine-generating enzyme required for sulfatase activity
VRTMRTRPARRLALALAAGTLAVLIGTAPHGQQVPPCDEPPLSLVDVEDFLKSHVALARILQKVSGCGVTFILDEEGARRLRQVGATDALLRVLAPPPLAAGARWTSPIDRRVMIGIGAGGFQMGSPEGETGRDPDEPQHFVQIQRPYWLDADDVTNEAYRRFVLAVPAWQKDRADRAYRDDAYLKDWTGNQYPSGAANHPVVWVSWHAAAAYARWAGKRLPTEAEWEYACRAGTTSAYWWGITFDPVRANNGPTLQPAGGEARRNPWGLSDMLGNVWQWTSSGYQAYPYHPDDGRENASGDRNRTARGGAWGKGEAFLRSANRLSTAARTTSEQIGFRCAR